MTKKLPHRRRREKKTDYHRRLKLLKSGEKRLVVRKHHNNTRVQIIEFDGKGDRTLVEADGEQLRGFGWKGHCGNLPAAYLIGYILGKKALGEKISRAVLDLGLHESTKGNRIYAAAKGVMDAGVDVPVGESVLPDEERIEGKNIEEYASEMNDSDKKKHFSKIMERGLDPGKISNHFNEIKEKIEKKLGE